MNLPRLSELLPSGTAPGQQPTPAPPTQDFGVALDALLHQNAPEAAQADTDTGVRFSKHATARLQSRGVEMTEGDMGRLEGAIDQLAARGAKESLVLMDDKAFIVGVPKRTVVTAMSRSEAMGNLFTNIDSTLFVP